MIFIGSRLFAWYGNMCRSDGVRSGLHSGQDELAWIVVVELQEELEIDGALIDA